MSKKGRLALYSVVCAFGPIVPVLAQNTCGEWTPGLFVNQGFRQGEFSLSRLKSLDDGTGPALYACGDFTRIGGAIADSIARFTEEGWSPLKSSAAFVHSASSAYVLDAAIFDDGSGPATYVTGNFTGVGEVAANYVARWNGTSWSPLGIGLDATGSALAVFDDGTGPALYVGGCFFTAGGTSAKGIARWNGSAWSPLIAPGFGFNLCVRALAVFDDGEGPALFAGGEFTLAGSVSANHVARWDGFTWSALAGTENGTNGVDGLVRSFAAFDDGSGPALYVGGPFTSAGGAPANQLAKWSDGTLSPVPLGVFGDLRALASFDDGLGPALFVSGCIAAAGGVPVSGIARFNGSAWSAVGGGLPGGCGNSLTVFDDGTGPGLYVGGPFVSAGSVVAHGVARWRAGGWSALPGVRNAPNGAVNVLASLDVGLGESLYAGGEFGAAGSVLATRIARWDGMNWSPLGGGMEDSVLALAEYDDGTGVALYAGGEFGLAGGMPASRVAKWNGSTWSALGSGLSAATPGGPVVNALASFDDGSGPVLYVGGQFDHAGSVPVSGFARWNGSDWSAVGTIIGQVFALLSFDDGTGPALYAGGGLTVNGIFPGVNVARWDGVSWSPLGSGTGGTGPLGGRVKALAVFDDGSGAALHAGGFFTTAGGLPANRVARWRNGEWTPLAGGVNSEVDALHAFDDGTGPALIAGGPFDGANFVPCNNIARWNGTTWSPLGSGMNSYRVSSLATFDHGTGPALYAAGPFDRAGGVVSSLIAQWRVASSETARKGNVNAGAGAIADVLFVNGSAGNAERVVTVSVGESLDLALSRTPAGPPAAGYVAWYWSGEASHTDEFFRDRERVGCFANPTPLHRNRLPQPFRCIRGVGIPSIVCRGVSEVAGAPSVPWTRHAGGGVATPRTITIQALIQDNAAANATGFSVTNAVILRIE